MRHEKSWPFPFFLLSHFLHYNSAPPLFKVSNISFNAKVMIIYVFCGVSLLCIDNGQSESVSEDKCKLSHIKFCLFIIFRLFHLYTCYPLFFFLWKWNRYLVECCAILGKCQNELWIKSTANSARFLFFFVTTALDIDFQKHNSIIYRKIIDHENEAEVDYQMHYPSIFISRLWQVHSFSFPNSHHVWWKSSSRSKISNI